MSQIQINIHLNFLDTINKIDFKSFFDFMKVPKRDIKSNLHYLVKKLGKYHTIDDVQRMIMPLEHEWNIPFYIDQSLRSSRYEEMQFEYFLKSASSVEELVDLWMSVVEQKSRMHFSRTEKAKMIFRWLFVNFT